VFENRVLRKIFGRKIEDVTGGWRIMHNEEFHSFTSLLLTKYYSGDQFKEDEMDGACGTHAGEKKCIHSFGRKI
jgi:hypothetical protein